MAEQRTFVALQMLADDVACPRYSIADIAQPQSERRQPSPTIGSFHSIPVRASSAIIFDCPKFLVANCPGNQDQMQAKGQFAELVVVEVVPCSANSVR